MTRVALCLALVIATPCTAAPRAKPAETADASTKSRIAALVLRRTEFGSISLIPVRLENARLAGPFDDGGRTTYCVTAQMYGRAFGRAERARAIVRVAKDGRLVSENHDTEVCAGHRTQPFPELETAAKR